MWLELILIFRIGYKYSLNCYLHTWFRHIHEYFIILFYRMAHEPYSKIIFKNLFLITRSSIVIFIADETFRARNSNETAKISLSPNAGNSFGCGTNFNWQFVVVAWNQFSCVTTKVLIKKEYFIFYIGKTCGN